MSLLNNAMTSCKRLAEIRTSDGEGGSTTVWNGTEVFNAAIVYEDTEDNVVGDASKDRNTYSIITGRETKLKYHDVFKRLKDGKIFRVTSDGSDNATPKTAGLNMRKVTAEEWKLTGAET